MQTHRRMAPLIELLVAAKSTDIPKRCWISCIYFSSNLKYLMTSEKSEQKFKFCDIWWLTHCTPSRKWLQMIIKRQWTIKHGNVTNYLLWFLIKYCSGSGIIIKKYIKWNHGLSPSFTDKGWFILCINGSLIKVKIEEFAKSAGSVFHP